VDLATGAARTVSTFPLTDDFRCCALDGTTLYVPIVRYPVPISDAFVAAVDSASGKLTVLTGAKPVDSGSSHDPVALGDGGPLSAAKFYRPDEAVYDAAGRELLIGDSGLIRAIKLPAAG
jgi:hypothetical protein